jgi:chitodextrinase
MNGTGARFGGLAPSTAYTIRVVVTGCSGQPIPSLPGSTVTTPAGSALRPQAPVEPTVAAVTDDSATLRWSAPAAGEPAVRYAVYEGATLIARTSSTSVTVRRLYHAQRYGFTVAAIDAAGNESAHTPPISVSTAVCPSPLPKPFALRAEAVSPSTVRLSWVQISWAVSYTVYDLSTPVATTTTPAAVLSGLASNSGHSYRVVATLVNGCGDTARSSSVSVRTPAGPTARPDTPISPYAFVASQNWNTNAVVAVTWSRPAVPDPALTYRVYEDATVVATSTGSRAEITVQVNTSHTYTVTAVDAAGNESAPSKPTTVRVPYFPLP